MVKKKWTRWIKIIVLLYCGIGIALYYTQDKLLFHPQPLAIDHAFEISQRFEEMRIPMNKTDTISLVRFLPAKGTPRGIVVYFHGNRKNVEHYSKYATPFIQKGYEVWMPDYPGFGKTTGERTEKILYAEAIQVIRLASSKYGADSIIIYGKSFGTGLATYGASEIDCKLLILESPYYSIPDLFSTYAFIYPTKWMSHYQVPLYSYLQDVKAPVVIFHGTNDGITTYSKSKKLIPFLKPGDQFITLENGSHNGLDTFALYRQVLDSLLN